VVNKHAEQPGKAEQPWDTLIKGALVFDGSGGYPRYRDLAIQEGCVAAIGKDLNPKSAREVVDAKGRWLMPGLLDIHTHYDLEVEVNPGLHEAIRHGTTSVVVGNCSLGTSFGAQRKNGDNPILDCFARVENLPKPILSMCVDKITWDNTADYLAHFEHLPLGPNIAPLIPHSMLRIDVMGVDGAISRQPTEQEGNKIRQLFSTALEQGYIGLSTDSMVFHYLSNSPHKKSRIPTQYASKQELRDMIELLRAKDRVWQTTPDSESPQTSIKRWLWTSGRLYKKPLRVTALVAMDFKPLPRVYKALLKLASLFNSKLLKGHFNFQALPTNFRIYANGFETPILEELEVTRELIEFEHDDCVGRKILLDDPAYQARFKAQMSELLPKKGWRKLVAGRPKATFEMIGEDMNIDTAPVKAWCGETMADVLARFDIYERTQGRDGPKDDEEKSAFELFPAGTNNIVDLLLHFLVQYDKGVRWWMDIGNTREEVIDEVIFNKNILPGFNDSGAHISNLAFNDGNLLTLKIAQKKSLAWVAKAVKRITREPAEFFGVDVGSIDIGSQADIIIINPKELSDYDTDKSRKMVYNDIFQCDTLVNRSDGVVEQVYIKGTRVWQEGSTFTDALGKQHLGRALTYVERSTA
jgi:N-acyl-D-aspartate/D-glutamate deacylase